MRSKKMSHVRRGIFLLTVALLAFTNIACPVSDPKVKVPNLVNKAQAAAETALRDAGLVVGAVTQAYHATVAAGHVITQHPPAGRRVSSGSSVDLAVSQGPEPAPVAVPDVAGRPLPEAEAALTGASFVVGAVTQTYHVTVPAGRVISQNPSAGSLEQPGLPVDLVVSQGPEPVAVPGVAGMSLPDAETALASAGFVVGAVAEAHHATLPAGAVISQNPPAGSFEQPGHPVDLVVSRGPEPVAVPYVVGMSLPDATAALESAGFVAGTLTEEYSNDVAAGSVISQNPRAGTLRQPGLPVDLAVCQGPEPVAMPAVVGKLLEDAETALTSAGFVVGAVTWVYSDDVAAGTVISQNPPAGSFEQPGFSVELVVSKGREPVEVPDVADVSLSDAQAVLTSAGLTVGTVTQAYHATILAGRVINQTPSAGASVMPGLAVDLVMSQGPAPVAVPDVVTMPFEDAKTVLTSAGFVVGTVTEAYHTSVAAGRVINQNPSAGSLKQPGLAVDLVVSQGPEFVEVPDVGGMSLTEAETALTSAGFVVGTVTEAYHTSIAAGSVISQNPLAGSFEQPGLAVDLVVSQGPEPVAVPDVAGMSLSGAETALTSVGFVMGTVTEAYHASIAAGTVISQNPSAGSFEQPGLAVDLVLSQGPEPVAVPDVVGMPFENAAAALYGAGLLVGTVTEEFSEDQVPGTVIRQTPASGSPVLPGSEVELVVAKAPIGISSIEELQKIGNDEAYPLDGYYILENDIDASATAAWNNGEGFEPIGWAGDGNVIGFGGHFDGNEKKISDLVIARPNGVFVGLFGSVSPDGVIKNLTLASAGGAIIGNHYTGSLVGENHGRIEGCVTESPVIGEGDDESGSTMVGGLIGANSDSGQIISCSAKSAVFPGSSCTSCLIFGGLVGWNDGVIEDCSVTGEWVIVQEVGGSLVGWNNGVIEGCFAEGSVSVAIAAGGLVGLNRGEIESCEALGEVLGDKAVGGLVGWVQDGTITASSASGDVQPMFGTEVGGLIGCAENSTVSQCYAEGFVWASNGVGGLIGCAKGSTVSQCFAEGFVSASDDAGGLIGYAEGATVSQCSAKGSIYAFGQGTGGLIGYAKSATITQCSAEGHVEGYEDAGGLIGATEESSVTQSYAWGDVNVFNLRAGGLVGAPDGGEIAECYSKGAIDGGGFTSGGLIGERESGAKPPTVSASFWDVQTSGTIISYGGQGLSTAQMMDKNTFTDAGWDFDAVWGIEQGVSYPYLRE